MQKRYGFAVLINFCGLLDLVVQMRDLLPLLGRNDLALQNVAVQHRVQTGRIHF